MSSRRRSPDRKRDGLYSSSSRAYASGSKLRMDRNAAAPRSISDPTVPAGRRREIDNVMKKARAHNSPTSNGYWDKKLLEVEEKDPNRWRHSGYKELYLEEGRRPSRSQSPAPKRPVRRNSRSFSRSRSPARRRAPSPRHRSPSVHMRRSPLPKSPPRHKQPARSPSGSSLSSCSDDSCSVCSPKIKRSQHSRSPSYSKKTKHASSGHTKPSRGPVSPDRHRAPPSNKTRYPPPRRSPPPHPSGMVPSRSTGQVKRPRSVSPLPPPVSQAPGAKLKVKEKQKRVLKTRIKKEKRTKSRQSPESSASDDSSDSVSDPVPLVQTTRLTLSERFGKMAQWSVDHRRDIENMRITKNSSGGDLKVMIEDNLVYGSPPPARFSHSPAPQGHYPEELLARAPSGMASWDDVRVRYQYYKERGYLRDLTLDDYVKWEEWWYKYQEWLKAERYYEHWLQKQQSHRRRKRVPVTQRLN